MDKVFLLSEKEAAELYKRFDARQCLPTEYAKKQGILRGSTDKKHCRWWLRSPGRLGDLRACVVTDSGRIDKAAMLAENSTASAGIRPAIVVRFK